MTEDTNQRGEMLRTFLAECDEPCPGCGYNLRGLTGEACPECGAGLRLGVYRNKGQPGWYLVGRLGILIALAFHGIVVLLVWPWDLMTAIMLSPGAGVSVLSWIIWSHSRHRVATMKSGSRMVVVSLAALMPLWTFMLTALLSVVDIVW